VPSGGGAAERLTLGAGGQSQPNVSSDGSRLAYAAGAATWSLVVRDLTSGEEARIPGFRDTDMATIAPDRSRVVFASQVWGRHKELGEQLLVDGVPSGPPRRLTDQPGDASHPAFSPDGAWIAYYRIIGEDRDIWIVPARGGEPRRFTEHAGSDVHPAWSPDGTALAFASDRENGYDIWVAPIADGRREGEPRRLTGGTVSAYAPAWSPDGALVAFLGVDESNEDVWVVPADGGARERRVTQGAGAGRMRWDRTTGALLVSGSWQTDRCTLWTVSPEDGTAEPVEPRVDFGPWDVFGQFDVSSDGRLLVYSQQELKGDIWVLEAEDGVY
jgi:Tol biopolymer transport system component